MKFLLSFRLGRPIALLAFLAPVLALAQISNSVTLDLTAGVLYNSSGVQLPPGGLVLLIADTNPSDGGFETLQAGSSLSLGSLLDAYDQIIGVTSIMSGPSGVAQASFTNIGLMSAQFPNLNTGDPIAVVWFSDLTSASTVLPSGEIYGLYSSITPNNGYPWLVPAATSTIELTFLTGDAGGTYPETDGYATMTDLSSVPEPATYSLIAGVAACLAGLARVIYSRKRALSIS